MRSSLLMLDLTRSAFAAIAVVPFVAAGSPAQQPGTLAAEPRLVNGATVEARIRSGYPDELRRMNLVARVGHEVFVNAEGRPDSVRLEITSGLGELDQVARAAIDSARFEPAVHDGWPAAAWTRIALLVHPTRPQVLDGIDNPLRALNRAEVSALAQSLYPDELRARSLGVAVPIALTIDGTGSPVGQAVIRTNCQMSATVAALAVAAQIRFEPTSGESNDQRIAFAIIFTAN
jgi:TonB family protein